MKFIPVWICVALLLLANVQLMVMQRTWKNAQPVTLGEMQRMIDAGRGYESIADRIPYATVYGLVEATIEAKHPIDVHVENQVSVTTSHVSDGKYENVPLRVEIDR